MSVYQRGKIWWIDITDPDGSRIQRSTKTTDKKKAQEWHDKVKAQLWDVKNLGVKVRHSWKECVVMWLEDKGHKKSIEDDKKHLRWLDTYLGDKYLDEINKQLIEKIKKAKKDSSASNATVNRVLALIKSMLNRAKSEWEWIDSVPKISLLPEPKKRVRWLKRNEWDRLKNELPAHLAVMAQFTLVTGLRESNVTQLQWSQIDMLRQCAWIHADESKSGNAIAIPLNSEACEIIRGEMGKNLIYVFTYEGEPVTRANNHAWRNALVRAGIKDFRWHDLRHTWATWLYIGGTPLEVIKELGGWSCLDIVMRYAHLSSDHLKGYAENATTARPVTKSLQA